MQVEMIEKMLPSLQPVADKSQTEEGEDGTIDLTELNPTQRIHHLERSILFLRQQHAEVLKSLHDEIDNLKKENKGKEAF